MCAIWQANFKSMMMFHVKHRMLSECSWLHSVPLLPIDAAGAWFCLDRPSRCDKRWQVTISQNSLAVGSQNRNVSRETSFHQLCAWAGSSNSARQDVWNQSLCSSCCCAPTGVVCCCVMNRLHMNPGRSVVSRGLLTSYIAMREEI